MRLCVIVCMSPCALLPDVVKFFSLVVIKATRLAFTVRVTFDENLGADARI